MLKNINTLLSNKILIVAFLVLGAISFFAGKPSEKMETESFLPAPPSVDTFIPAGHVLVSLELVNAESLASMVGDVGGVVDLYLASQENRKGGLKVGSRLKLLRAPLNPQQYAVLVHETEGPRLLSYQGPFVAVVQNPDARGTKVTSSPGKKLTVNYQN